MLISDYYLRLKLYPRCYYRGIPLHKLLFPFTRFHFHLMLVVDLDFMNCICGEVSIVSFLKLFQLGNVDSIVWCFDSSTSL